MTIQRKYNFKPGTKISSVQMNEELDQLIAAANNLEAADNLKDKDLRTIAQLNKITSDDGNTKISVNATSGDVLAELSKLGKGLHTFYAISGSKNLPPSNISIRGIAHLTSDTFGWAYATDYKNTIFTNYLDSGNWSGWDELTSRKSPQDTLWSGSSYPSGDATIKPSKKLSECRNGWILIWSDNDAGVGVNNYNFAFSLIPKSFPKLHSGGGTYFTITNNLTDKVVSVTAKYLYIYDDKFTGHADNTRTDNNSNDVALRYVLEW